MCGSLHCFNISSEESRSLTPCTEPQVCTGTAILFPSSAVKGPSLCLHQVLPDLQYSLPPPPPIYFPLRDWKTHPFVSWILTAVVTYITDRLLSYCAWALLPCLDEKLHRQLCCFLWKEKCIMTKISGLEITLPGFLVSLQQYLFYNFGKS